MYFASLVLLAVASVTSGQFVNGGFNRGWGGGWGGMYERHRPYGHHHHHHERPNFNNDIFNQLLQILLSQYSGSQSPLSALTTQAPTTTTQLCSGTLTLDQALILVQADNDRNNDGLVKVEDLNTDVNTYYDVNGDGILTHQECVDRMKCRYNASEQQAQYICADILQGFPNASTSAFNRAPFLDGLPIDVFIANARQRYTNFTNFNCVNTNLTTNQKLDLNIAQNDRNGDGTVTPSEVQTDLTLNYDVNGDGIVTRKEWTKRWICAYGDSAGYANVVFESIAGVGASNFTISTFVNNFTSTPAAGFRAFNEQTYNNYAAQNP